MESDVIKENDLVLVTTAEGVVEIVLNRPAALNAIDVAMAEALRSACRDIAADSSARVVMIRGSGKAFMAGGDLRSFHDDIARAEQTANRLIEPMNEVVMLLGQMRMPTIAILHGPVAGAGVSLALACDISIAADDVVLNLAYTRIGASLDVGASWTLPRIVGLRKAMELALLSENVTAAEAMRMNLVSRVVPTAELASQAATLASHLASGPTRAYGEVKRLLRTSFDRTLDSQLEEERVAFGRCSQTTDFAEGVDAFVMKRSPRFTGR